MSYGERKGVVEILPDGEWGIIVFFSAHNILGLLLAHEVSLAPAKQRKNQSIFHRGQGIILYFVNSFLQVCDMAVASARLFRSEKMALRRCQDNEAVWKGSNRCRSWSRGCCPPDVGHGNGRRDSNRWRDDGSDSDGRHDGDVTATTAMAMEGATVMDGAMAMDGATSMAMEGATGLQQQRRRWTA